MLGFILLYVGCVLTLNGLWLLGKISDKEIWMVNLFVGAVTLLLAFIPLFGRRPNLDMIKGGALTLLFSLTYIWVGVNRLTGADGRGLGWFSLFVAITALPVGIQGLLTATTLWGMWLALCWLAWAGLWFVYFLLLALNKPLIKQAGIFTLACGIFTGWLPGYLLLVGVLA